MRIKISNIRRFLATTLLILMVVTTTACSSSTTATVPNPTEDRGDREEAKTNSSLRSAASTPNSELLTVFYSTENRCKS